MSKFNTAATRPAVKSPIVSERTPTGRTHEGAPGYGREAKGELFLLSVANMVGESAFYEKAANRDNRYSALVRQVAIEDPHWLLSMLTWLRAEANMRSASLVGACEMVKARLDAKAPQTEGAGRDVNRLVIDAVCQRADEPGELLAYWTSTYGRAIPMPVKRGVADAVQRLYGEYSLTKYDSDSKGFRFGDVIDLVHPAPAAGKPFQGDLFRHALDRRHNRDNPIPESLATLRARAELLSLPVPERRPALLGPDGADRLKAAGMTWEAVAGWLQGPMDGKAWEAVIPSMGIMALARNLRNFDEAGVSDQAAAIVAAKFADPEQVARSRMFPFRWWQAYQAAPSLRWAHALDKALTASTANIPAFPGRTLVLVDTSASMTSGRLSGKSNMSCAQAAALFGVALSLRGSNVDLHGFADGVFEHGVAKGGSVLREMEGFVRRIGEVGHGTQIAESVRRTYRGHDRVIILSDMQTMGGGWGGNVTDMAPKSIPMYGFNLAGYQHGAIPSGTGTRHELGGMTDATFRLIPLLEAGRSAAWPWEA